MKKKGFTLIELLVVIAIVGVLASIVMVSMSGATSKAKDSRVQGDLSQVRNLAELIYDTDGDFYDRVCVSATSLGTGHASYGTQLTVVQNDIEANCATDGWIACHDASTTFCVEVELDSGGGFYCIDSEGRKQINSASSCASDDQDCS